MLTCKEASFLASKKIDSDLTRNERIGLWLHLAMCGLCRRYAREINKMHEMMQKAGQNEQGFISSSIKLSSQSRERIKQALNQVLRPRDKNMF